MNETPGAITPDPSALTPAGLGKRSAAAIIDLILLIVLMVVMGLIFGGTSKTTDNGLTNVSVDLSGWTAVAYFALSFAYFWLLEALTGQTLGKMAFGLRVVAPDGSLIGLTRSLIRNLVRIVDFLPLFDLVGFICAVASKQRQRLGDMAAGSIVTEARLAATHSP